MDIARASSTGNIASLLLDALAERPEAPAIREPSGRVTSRGALRAQAIGVAAYLQAQGLHPGDRIALQLAPGAALAAAVIGALAAGGTGVLLEPNCGPEVYRARVSAASPRWALVDPRLSVIQRTPGASRWLASRGVMLPPPLPVSDGLQSVSVTASRLEGWARRAPGAWSPAPRAADDTAVIAYTGGTTSHPRGVLLGHGGLASYLGNIADLAGDLPLRNLLADTPGQMLYALRLGWCAHVVRGGPARRVAEVARRIESGEVDAYFGSPYLWTALLDRPGWRVPASLRMVLLGAAPVTAAFLRRLRAALPDSTQVVSLYGLTEVGPATAASVGDKLAFEGAGDFVGAPRPGVRVTIDAPDADGVGEVVVHSPSLYTGYLGEAPRGAEEGLRTGDLGRLVPHRGREALVLLGRRKDMILRNGVNHYPGSYEPALRELGDASGPWFAEVALIGLWNERRQDEAIVFCYRPTPGRSLTADVVRRGVERVTGAEAAPDTVLAFDAFPVVGRQNKLDRRALRDLASQRGAISASAALPGARLPFDWSAFARRYRPTAGAGLTEQLGPAGFRLGLWAMAQATWAADEVLHRNWRDTELPPPIFILGHQRSGTTALHRWLASDPRAHAFRLHEMLFPALSAQRVLGSAARWDARWGGRLARWIHAAQDDRLADLDPIHRIRFDAVEEDEFALWALFSSPMCVSDGPRSLSDPALDDLRDFSRWTPERQIATLGYFRACLLKNARRYPGTWPVIKNPAFTQRIPQLVAMFPDARWIYLHRDPVDAIASRLNLVRAIWRLRTPGIDLSPAHVDAIVADSVRTYRAASRDWSLLPEARRVVVRFEALREQSGAVVRSVYRTLHLGEPPEILPQESTPGSSVSTLNDFGCSPDRIRALLDGWAEPR